MTRAPDGLHRTDLMAQLHTGTVMRAMFAGGIALWSKAATIAKVRTSLAPRTPRRGWHPLRFCDPAPLTAPLPVNPAPQAGGGVATKAAMAAAGTGAAYTGYKTVAAPTQDK